MNDLPTFPVFRELCPADKPLLDSYVVRFAPYAETTFATLLLWNPPGGAKICQLNGLPVIWHATCDTGRPALTFLGPIPTAEPVHLLVQSGLGDVALIPDYSIAGIHSDEWQHRGLVRLADRDNDDYVYDLAALANLEGPGLASRRKRMNAFLRARTPRLQVLDLGSASVGHEVIACCVTWYEEREAAGAPVSSHELDGVERTMQLARQEGGLGLSGYGVRVEGQLVAVSLVERHGSGTVSGVVFKALPSANGSAEYLRGASAQHLFSLGYRFINAQQDMGLPGLRAAKSSYRPARMLAKWRIQLSEECADAVV